MKIFQQLNAVELLSKILSTISSRVLLLFSGIFLPHDHPGAKLSAFSAPRNESRQSTKAAYAALIAAKTLRNR